MPAAIFPPLGGPTTARRSAEPALSPPPPGEPADSFQLEGLITTLATSFISLAAGEVDSAICRSLGMLGEFAGAQRSYICLISEEGTRLRYSHQWCAAGVQPLESGTSGFSAEAFPWWVEKLRNLEDVHISDLADLPPEARHERDFLKANHVRSTLMVPLRYGPSLT